MKDWKEYFAGLEPVASNEAQQAFLDQRKEQEGQTYVDVLNVALLGTEANVNAPGSFTDVLARTMAGICLEAFGKEAKQQGLKVRLDVVRWMQLGGQISDESAQFICAKQQAEHE